MEIFLTRSIGISADANTRSMLLLSGILSSVIYVATDIVASFMTAVMSLFILLSIGSGAFLAGKWFMTYSFATIIVVIIFGLMTVNQVPDLEAGPDTPWMGLKERVNIYLTMLWFAVLSLNLFQQEREDEY